MKQKYIFIGLGVTIIGLLVAASIFGGKRQLPEVKTATTSSRSIIERVSASGKMQPELEVNISAEVSGQLIDLPVKEGHRVEVGDLLAQINPDVYISAKNRAQAAVNTTMSNLSSSKAMVATSEANLFVAEKEWSRTVTLFKNGVISQADYDRSEAAFRTAEANLVSSQEGVKSANYSILSAKASLQEALDNLSRTTLKAPQAGIVTALVKEEGESVQGNGFVAGEVVMKISNLDLMEVNIEVNESDIVRVKMGNEAEIEVDAYLNQTFTGSVTEIGNTALNAGSNGFNLDQVTNFSVKVRINTDSYSHLISDKSAHQSPFRPGMSATVELLTKSVSDVIAVPIQCVTTRKADDSDDAVLGVFVIDIESSKIKWTVVETGIQDNRFIEIVSGLSEEVSVVSGPYDLVSRKLEDGDEVEIKVVDEDERGDNNSESNLDR
ncbi:MAG TPA: efflux RND transporter periplasmic adaptor subunit [Flavobacteriales bacterium]|nr:efflux RND transporter periplasmic adaptor subunit [Flavobacteriales bacterium]